MALGPGKYDAVCTMVRREVGFSDDFIQNAAGGVLVIVIGGNKGNGFSCQADPQTTMHLPDLLENIARQLREDGIGSDDNAYPPSDAFLQGIREAVFAKCAEIADKYNDCGGDFIAQKIRDEAYALPPCTGAGQARIEVLEAALQMIVLSSKDGRSIEIARAALAPERRHTTPEATERKDWPKDGFINDYD
jgi:hypothetical protein